jgi:hypothetical protein
MPTPAVIIYPDFRIGTFVPGKAAADTGPWRHKIRERGTYSEVHQVDPRPAPDRSRDTGRVLSEKIYKKPPPHEPRSLFTHYQQFTLAPTSASHVNFNSSSITDRQSSTSSYTITTVFSAQTSISDLLRQSLTNRLLRKKRHSLTFGIGQISKQATTHFSQHQHTKQAAISNHERLANDDAR